MEESSQPRAGDECPDCGLRLSRPGTVTAWIFQSSYCSCNSGSGGPSDSSVRRTQESLQKPLLGNRYKFLSPLGRGGVAHVYKVQDSVTDEILAAKVMFTELALNELAVRRFQKEVDVLCDLEHQNLVRIHGYANDRNGIPYLIMEYIEGENLEQVVKFAGPLDFRSGVNLFVQICSGLAYVHGHGIIHRDLKPGNVIVSSADHVTLIDFGFARLVDGPDDSRLTATGEAFGSPAYMSPEHCLGQELDERSDIYSLGCLMYHALSGKPPIEGENALATVAKQVRDTPGSLRSINPAVPKNLDNVVLKCLEKEPAMRYSTVNDVKADLLKVLSGKHIAPAATAREKRSESRSWASGSSPLLLNKWAAIAAALLLITLSGAIGAWIATGSGAKRTPPAQTVQSAPVVEAPIAKTESSATSTVELKPQKKVTPKNSARAEPGTSSQNTPGTRETHSAKMADKKQRADEHKAQPSRSRPPTQPVRSRTQEQPASFDSHWKELKKLREFN